ncbi:response regulator [Marispirochaeta aestuarii]|jgi:two-component system chemotaxis response regulator CheY|uniref:Two-component system response regulator n=1 Tax=Marispirochaeta aestuarii TaxID=1963862 RepID=A0A1Y1RVH2_9SPIO|nr:response regulator [Marispirochaeta aestuarii]ORC34021.1 two-component system response regulator [Marispirochaeta aestuarii]
MIRGLIVDDAAIMRLRLREILEPRYEIVAEAGDGNEAIEMYDRYKPDFITLDISMPNTNGMEALEILMQRTPPPRIIIVSAVGQQRLVIKALQGGAKDFVIKPFESPRVLKAVERVMSNGTNPG